MQTMLFEVFISSLQKVTLKMQAIFFMTRKLDETTSLALFTYGIIKLYTFNVT